ncbi:LysM peptidoglycan-binding domain-containing protein [Nocardioides sp.]|uniref:LysM peptidoglycan-binding domain-containing protein n=1 Tax=Nocardioides sp. TaxID=35761 RepID=UPI002724DEB0|nr:LysM domain-containing protein [Nocardioides sp.]MDO9456130.1 LysM domain-containing protein [Nocardioides sp.]
MVAVGRCLLVWVVTTVVAAVTTWWSLSALAPVDGFDRFDRLVAATAGVALAGCSAWAWLVCTVVVAQAVARPGRAPRHTAGVPAWASRTVLAACGVAVLAAVPAQASYDVPHTDEADRATTLDGLPFPDRAVGPAHAARAPAEQPPAETVVVRPGDSLWRIAAARLPPGASAAEVAAATAALHDLNRTVVGPDPDLIHPGLRLRAPES